MNSAKNSGKHSKKPRAKSTKRTEIEDGLALQLDLAGIQYIREYKAIPGRKFKWDFCFPSDCWMMGLPSSSILLEVQGGIWVQGGHSTGTGIERDMEKLNLATVNGFRVLQVGKKHVKNGEALRWVQEAVKK